jgi:hypothetical protein
MFQTLYADPARLEQFMSAMRGISAPNFQALAEEVDFTKYRTLWYRTLCDAGGATGLLSSLVARRHPHLRFLELVRRGGVQTLRSRAPRRAVQRGHRVQVAVYYRSYLPIHRSFTRRDWNLSAFPILECRSLSFS